VRPRVFQPAPPFHFTARREEEARAVLGQSKVLACRWFTPVAESGAEANASVFVVRPPYDMARLSAKGRNQTRRGLERVEVRRGCFNDEVEPTARAVYFDNVQRLGLFRTEADAWKRWRQWESVLRDGSCAQFWGAWKDGALVAFSVVVPTPWGVEIVCQRSSKKFLDAYPNNALVYTIVTEAFRVGDLLVSFGLSEFGSGPGGLDHFKKGMGFEAVRLEEHYEFAFLPGAFQRWINPTRLRRCYQMVTRSHVSFANRPAPNPS
jgi:hypothetical protein